MGKRQDDLCLQLSHLSDKAIMEDSDYRRNSVSLKLNNKATERITLDFSVRYTDTRIDGGGANDASSTLIPTSG